MKQIVIIGLGHFGTHLARKLTEMGCDVLAIDRREPEINAIRDHVNEAIIGDARKLETLKSLVPADVDDVVVCLGDSLEASVLCALHLRNIGVKSIRAKAASEDHADILKAVGVHEVIFPERETAERTARKILNPNLIDYFPLTEEYRIMEVVAPNSLVGQSLIESKLRNKYKLLVLAIRNETTNTFNCMPEPDTVIIHGDILVVLGRELDLALLSAKD